MLRTLWPQVPLGAIMKAIRKGEVRLDAKKAAQDTRLEEGQFLQVPWDDELPHAAPETRKNFAPLETLYRDDFAWIVNKPAGLLTQPDEKDGDSLITRALAEPRWTRADFRPATVQRLDRNTSGAVLIALTGKAQRLLSEMIRERRIHKTYWAVVSGDLPASGEIDSPLLKDPQANKVSIDERGQKALTRFRRLAAGKHYCLAELELVTGRPHQARAHLASIGCPILGGVKYGGDGKVARRPLLHARFVEFPQERELPRAHRGHRHPAECPPRCGHLLPRRHLARRHPPRLRRPRRPRRARVRPPRTETRHAPARCPAERARGGLRVRQLRRHTVRVFGWFVHRRTRLRRPARASALCDRPRRTAPANPKRA